MAPVLLCLLALVVAAGGSVEAPSPVSEPAACPVCLWRRHSKELRLESIKSQILSKLRLKEAPNITREVVKQLLPKAPPLQQLLDLHDFQGDSLQHDEYLEEDEYHATTETVISMAQESQCRLCSAAANFAGGLPPLPVSPSLPAGSSPGSLRGSSSSPVPSLSPSPGMRGSPWFPPAPSPFPPALPGAPGAPLCSHQPPSAPSPW